MKNKRLWLSVALTVLVVVCAMLILSRINETRSNAAPAAPTDLIPPAGHPDDGAARYEEV